MVKPACNFSIWETEGKESCVHVQPGLHVGGQDHIRQYTAK